MADILDVAQANQTNTPADPTVQASPPPSEPPAEPAPEPPIPESSPVNTVPASDSAMPTPPAPVSDTTNTPMPTISVEPTQSDNLVVPPPNEPTEPEPPKETAPQEPPVETKQPEETKPLSGKPKRKFSPGLIISAVVLFLVALPLTVLYVANSKQLASLESRAAKGCPKGTVYCGQTNSCTSYKSCVAAGVAAGKGSGSTSGSGNTGGNTGGSNTGGNTSTSGGSSGGSSATNTCAAVCSDPSDESCRACNRNPPKSVQITTDSNGNVVTTIVQNDGTVITGTTNQTTHQVLNTTINGKVVWTAPTPTPNPYIGKSCVIDPFFNSCGDGATCKGGSCIAYTPTPSPQPLNPNVGAPCPSAPIAGLTNIGYSYNLCGDGAKCDKTTNKCVATVYPPNAGISFVGTKTLSCSNPGDLIGTNHTCNTCDEVCATDTTDESCRACRQNPPQTVTITGWNTGERQTVVINHDGSRVTSCVDAYNVVCSLTNSNASPNQTYPGPGTTAGSCSHCSNLGGGGTTPPPGGSTTTGGGGGGGAPQCVSIVVYQNGNALSQSDLANLQPGATVTLAYAPGGASTKVRFAINPSTNPPSASDWQETTTKNSQGQFTLDYVIPTNVTSFSIQAQWFDGTSWH